MPMKMVFEATNMATNVPRRPLGTPPSRAASGAIMAQPR